MTAEDAMRAIKESLDQQGIAYDTEEALNAIEKMVDKDYKEVQAKGRKLMDKRDDIFRSCGATEAQLQWGMYKNVRLGPINYIRIMILNRQIRKLCAEYIPAVSYLAFVNEEKERLKKKEQEDKA